MLQELGVFQSADLMLWPSIGLVLFFLSMSAVFLWAFRPGARHHYERSRFQVLEEDQVSSTVNEG